MLPAEMNEKESPVAGDHASAARPLLQHLLPTALSAFRQMESAPDCVMQGAQAGEFASALTVT